MTPDSSKKGQETREKYEIQLVNLYEEYFDKIARYAFAHIGDRTEAEDIAGEVFLRALKSLDSFRDCGIPLQSWLFKIAHNMVVDYFRKKSRYLMVRNDETRYKGEDDPESRALSNLEMEKVKIALQKLTEEQREVINLRFFAGLPSKEVAILLNKTDGAVREMQRAALVKLRQMLNKENMRGE